MGMLTPREPLGLAPGATRSGARWPRLRDREASLKLGRAEQGNGEARTAGVAQVDDGADAVGKQGVPARRREAVEAVGPQASSA